MPPPTTRRWRRKGPTYWGSVRWGQVFAKTFSVSAGVATPLDETRWRLAEPRAGSRQPLLIQFDRIMDAAICEEEIAVVDLACEAVACSVSLDESTSELRVTPAVPWSAAPIAWCFPAVWKMSAATDWERRWIIPQAFPEDHVRVAFPSDRDDSSSFISRRDAGG